MVVIRSSSLVDSLNSKKSGETWLVRQITRFFASWSKFVARNAVLLIVICNIFTLIGTMKIVTTPNENDITGYTPPSARARKEFDIMTEFFSKNGNGITEFVLILPKDGGTVLRKDVLSEVLRVEEILTTKFKIGTKNHSENYNEFCYSFCQINEPLVHFTKAYIAQLDGKEKLDRVVLNYPITTMYSRKLNIQPSFFGVELYEDNTLAGEEKPISNMKSAKMIAVQLRAERKENWTTHAVKDYEMAVTDYFEKSFSSEHIRVLTLSTTFVEQEVVRAGMSLLPFLVVGFAIMAVVSTITTFISASYFQQVSIHKLSLAITACICPFMACGTALGFMFLCGVRFGSILCVTPFLVLAIGVDDAYLMIHAWQRVTARRRAARLDNDTPADRLAEVLADTGPAIMISALTNILADCCGVLNSSPEVTLLAMGNMACIFVDFIYQITFYSAVMVIAGHFEMRAERDEQNTQKIECGADGSSEKSSTSFHDNVKRRFGDFLNGYISLVTNGFFQFGIFVIWAGFLAVSIYGVTKAQINLTPKKLFSTDSSLIEMDDMRVAYVVPYFTLASVFVSNPGNMSDPERVAKLDQFVEDMEALPGCWGRQSTNYFVRDLKEFDQAMSEMDGENASSSLNMDLLPTFLDWPEYSFWKGFVRFHEDGEAAVTLDKFFITFAFRGDNLKEWTARGAALKSWRTVIDKYSGTFNVSVYSDDGIYLDLIDNMPNDAWQSSLTTLACMALICFVFMFDMFTVVIATGIIASVMTGILGILTLTGTDLDPIVMAALIISIGFSVDIPAHVSYHYHTAGEHIDHPDSLKQRLKHTLNSVGFPAIQASISTSLCVLSLKLTDVYMSNVFVKTMLLCMLLCVTHALVLIPCLVSLLHPLVMKITKK